MQTSATTPHYVPSLGEPVTLIGSTEHGIVTCVANYRDESTQYQVRYINSQGCLTTAWFPAAALDPYPSIQADQPAPSDIAKKLEITARLVKNGNAAMSPNDKAAFGIDTFKLTQNTPEELNARVSAFLEALSGRLFDTIGPPL